MAVPLGEDPNPLSVRYVLGLIRRQWPLIVILFVLAGLASSAVISKRKPKFRSTALLVLDRTPTPMSGAKSDYPEHKVDTEVEMLQAMSVIAQVAEQLKRQAAQNDGSSRPPAHQSISGSEAEAEKPWWKTRQAAYLLNLFAPMINEPRTKDEYSEELLALQRQFRIRRHGLTDVISIEAKAASPERAAHMANAYVSVYLAEQTKAKIDVLDQLENAIRKQIAALKARLSEAGASLDLRKELAAALSHLDRVERLRSVTKPDLRLLSKALPIRQVAFPSPHVFLLFSLMLSFGAAMAGAFAWDQYSIRYRYRRTEKDT